MIPDCNASRTSSRDQSSAANSFSRRKFLQAGVFAGLGLSLPFADHEGRAADAGETSVDRETTMDLFRGFTAETVETRGTTIHVLRKGSGRPLLLLHGYPETHLTWHKIAPQLAEQFSVVVPDLRGCGASGKPEGGERH